MNDGNAEPRTLAADVAKLRQEFDAAARSGHLMGQQAKTALAAIQMENGRAISGSKELSRVLSGAFGDVIEGGKSFQEILRSVASDLAKLAAENLFGAIGGGGRGGGFDLGSLLGGIVSASANGNVMQGGRLQAFAKGGVLSNPTMFPMSGGLGLAGEAGAEAVMPLARGADGKLGVTVQGNSRPLHVTFNVTATDAASFQRSETQVAAMLSRTVSRGARNL
jgi:phage-related minor tail protein